MLPARPGADGTGRDDCCGAAEGRRRPRDHKRRASPGKDLLSKVVTLEIDGRPISDAGAVNYATVILFGGLETVATMMGFFARFLAENPAHRRQLAERIGDEAFVKNAIEELLRRHGIAAASRKVTSDFSYKGIAFRAGDMILPPARIVSLLSQEMTLEPGDLVACGTSVGALPMRPGMTVEVSIEGIGTLRNLYEG